MGVVTLGGCIWAVFAAILLIGYIAYKNPKELKIKKTKK